MILRARAQQNQTPNPEVSFIMIEKNHILQHRFPPPFFFRERTLGSSRKPANQQCCSSQSRPKEQFRSASLLCWRKNGWLEDDSFHFWGFEKTPYFQLRNNSFSGRVIANQPLGHAGWTFHTQIRSGGPLNNVAS